MRSLSEADRVRALAALVALGFAGNPGDGRTLEEEILRATQDEPRSFTHWTNFEHQRGLGTAAPARDLARAWAATETTRRAPVRVRARVDRSEVEASDVVEWLERHLRHPAATIAGLFFETDGLARSWRWSWPLRIAVVQGDAGDRVAETIAKTVAANWPGIATVHRPSGAVETTEVVLVPDLPDDPRALAALAGRHRAALVIAQGKLPVARSVAVAQAFGASALALVDRDIAESFLELLVQLSHDAPLDVALSRAGRWGSPGSARILLATAALVESSRLDQVRAQVAHRVAAARLHLARAAPPAAALVGAKLHDLDYARETQGAADVSRASRAVESAMAVANQLHPPRWLQARVHSPTPEGFRVAFEELGGGPVASRQAPRAERFAKDRWHLIAVHVGEPLEGALRGDSPVNEQLLQFRFHRERVNVVLAAPHCLVIPLRPATNGPPGAASVEDLEAEAGRRQKERLDSATSEIDLPEFGDSDAAWFALRPGSEEVEARILLVHENRVLQTGLLTGGKERAIAMRTEAAVYGSLEALHGRRKFDAAFVVNDSADGEPRLTRLAGNRAELRELSDAKPLFDRISDLLGQLTDDARDFSDPSGEDLRSLLVRLANFGVSLRRRIVEDTDLFDLRAADRFQIVAARPEAFLPLELVYDGPAPDDAAQLCPGCAEALRSGACAACPDRESRKVVCPVRFWGMSKLIERHVFRRADARTGAPDFAVTADPAPGHHRFGRPSSCVFAYSSRAALTDAAKQALASIPVRLAELSGCDCTPVESWDAWRAMVGRVKPSVLAVVPHTDRDGGDERLEIATGSFLRAPQIDGEIVGPARPRLAVLFGCTTADPALAFASFPAHLRGAGVEIIVGTLSAVLGRHAGPAMDELLRALAEAWTQGKETTLADLVRKLRRDLISKGLPFGMTVVAYGDADWTFGGEPC